MARQDLTEAAAHTEILEANKDGSFLVQVISPGWGSSGYYAPEVVEAAGKDKVWPKGTHMYFDHPSMSEAEDRPERSVMNLAATLAEDAYWDRAREALVAKVTPTAVGKPLLSDQEFRKAIACSVRASAEMNIGEAENRSGWIIEKIYPSKQNSVDFVTHAGRGGMILEAARRASEATANDRSQQLSDAVRAKYSAAKTYVWTRDYDDTRVWFEISNDSDKAKTFEQTYTVDDGDLSVTLTGTKTEVRVRTQYVPLKATEAGIPKPDLTRETALKQVREARNVGQWMESRIHLGFTQVADEMFGDGKLTRDERIALSSGIGAALDVFTATVEDTAPQLYSRDLWTDPEARAAVAEAATPNVPRHAAGQPNTIRENTMPGENEGAATTIEESKRRELEEKASRVDVAEAKVVEVTARAEKAEQELAVEKAKEYARDFATKRVREANSELAGPVVEKVVAEAMREIPLTEAEKAADRRLDTEAFGKRVDEARKEQELYLATVIENSGATVRGLGPVSEKKEVTAADTQRAIDEAFGRQSKEG